MDGGGRRHVVAVAVVVVVLRLGESLLQRLVLLQVLLRRRSRVLILTLSHRPTFLLGLLSLPRRHHSERHITLSDTVMRAFNSPFTLGGGGEGGFPPRIQKRTTLDSGGSFFFFLLPGYGRSVWCRMHSSPSSPSSSQMATTATITAWGLLQYKRAKSAGGLSPERCC